MKKRYYHLDKIKSASHEQATSFIKCVVFANIVKIIKDIMSLETIQIYYSMHRYL